jgi:hypothetical protein
MIKFLKIVLVFLILPVFALSQNGDPGTLKGVLVIEEKPVEFNYLSTPDGTTEIPYYKNLPTKQEYLSNLGKELLPLQKVKDIHILHFSDSELQSLYELCEDCILFKATVTLDDHSGVKQETVYLSLNYFTWKNSSIKGLEEPHIAELRFVEAVIMNENIER